MAHKDKRFNPVIADHARALWGQFLQLMRKDLKLSQQELADMAGVHRNAIVAMEAGRSNYAINTFIAVLDCLRIKVDFIEQGNDT